MPFIISRRANGEPGDLLYGWFFVVASIREKKGSWHLVAGEKKEKKKINTKGTKKRREE